MGQADRGRDLVGLVVQDRDLVGLEVQADRGRALVGLVVQDLDLAAQVGQGRVDRDLDQDQGRDQDRVQDRVQDRDQDRDQDQDQDLDLVGWVVDRVRDLLATAVPRTTLRPSVICCRACRTASPPTA